MGRRRAIMATSWRLHVTAHGSAAAWAAQQGAAGCCRRSSWHPEGPPPRWRWARSCSCRCMRSMCTSPGRASLAGRWCRIALVRPSSRTRSSSRRCQAPPSSGSHLRTTRRSRCVPASAMLLPAVAGCCSAAWGWACLCISSRLGLHCLLIAWPTCSTARASASENVPEAMNTPSTTITHSPTHTLPGSCAGAGAGAGAPATAGSAAAAGGSRRPAAANTGRWAALLWPPLPCFACPPATQPCTHAPCFACPANTPPCHCAPRLPACLQSATQL